MAFARRDTDNSRGPTGQSTGGPGLGSGPGLGTFGFAPQPQAASSGTIRRTRVGYPVFIADGSGHERGTASGQDEIHCGRADPAPQGRPSTPDRPTERE